MWNATVKAYSSPAFVSPSGSNTVLKLPSTSYQGAPIRRSPNKDRSTSLESFQVEAEGAPTEWRFSFSTGLETPKQSQSFHQVTNSIVAADEDLMSLIKKRGRPKGRRNKRKVCDDDSPRRLHCEGISIETAKRVHHPTNGDFEFHES